MTGLTNMHWAEQNASAGKVAGNGSSAFLEGGGQMGVLTRARDWANTPLGPIGDWPRTLKTAVSICLGSRHPIVIWWDEKHLTQFYNDGYISFLGAAKHPHALGQSARECWAEIWHIIDPMLRDVFRTGEATWSEDFLYAIDRTIPREEGYFTFSYSPIRDDDGVVRGIFCACSETTARVIGERRLRTLSDLSHMEVQTDVSRACALAAQTLGTNRADIPFSLIYLVDDDRRFARLASTTGLQVGYPASLSVVDLRSEGAQPSWPLAEVLRTGIGQTVPHLSVTYGRLDGSPWPESPDTAMVVPIPSPGQSGPAGVFVCGLSPRRVIDADYCSFINLAAGHIGTSVANVRAYEVERKRAEALAAIDRAKTAFFSNVSHEFRTPLTLMLGPIEEMLNNSASAPLSAEHQQLLEVTHRNSLRLLRLVNTLLDFARIEAGRIQARYQLTDLAALTADLAAGFRSATERAGLFLEVECPTLSELVYVDRDMWEKVVLNLLSNAFKFTLQGGISVALKSAEGGVQLAVRDTGVGIPEQELPRLFERFHRVEGVRGRTHEGSGIGLALVQELTKLHGGTVSVDSRLGRGSTFTVHIPLGAAHLPVDQMQAEYPLESTSQSLQPYIEEALRWLPAPADAYAPEDACRDVIGDAFEPQRQDGGTALVVVADDNADMRDYVARLLKQDYRVQTVSDGVDALAVIKAGHPDLLVSDVMMPRLDGFSLVREIRSDPELAGLPIILVSGRAGEEESIQGLEAGADDYLAKPFGARELIARVAATLNMARVRKQFEQHIAADLRSMTLLQEIGTKCARGESSIEECLGDILNVAVEITGADKGTVQLFDSATGTLRLIAHRGFEQPFVNFFARVAPAEASVRGTALDARGRIVVEDVTQSEVFAGQVSLGVILGAGVRAVQSTPLLGSSGAVLGMVSTYFAQPHRPDDRKLRLMDLLARLAADYLERKNVEDTLQRAQAQLQSIFDDVPIGVYLVDSELRIRRVNPTALVAFGDIPDLIGRDFSEVIYRIWPRPYADEVIRRFHRTLETGEPYRDPELVEERIDRGTTEYYEWEIHRVPLMGERRGVVCYFQDISARVLGRREIAEAGEKLRQLNSELEERVVQEVAAREQAQARLAQAQRMEALGQLAGGIAHDFNNVLQAVHGGAALIERRPSNQQSVHRLARLVVEAAERGSTITRRLLAFSRRSELYAEPIEPVSLLTDMREILIHTLGAGIGVRLDAEPILPPLLADKGQLETVLVNLATNARDAMENKGVLTLGAAIDIVQSVATAGHPALLKPGRYVRLWVSDTGTGMTPEILARVTEPFYTTKDPGKGTGLGLAMARGFAEQSEGGLQIVSAIGQGTTVTLWFPVSKSVPAAMQPPSQDEAIVEGKERARLLVVDDDPLVREIITSHLEAAGYTAVAAPDGATALAFINAGEAVDLVIADLSMPRMDGLSLLREVQRRRSKLPAILLTGFASNAAEVAVGGALGGDFALLRKPVTAQQLTERIEMLLEGMRRSFSPG